MKNQYLKGILYLTLASGITNARIDSSFAEDISSTTYTTDKKKIKIIDFLDKRDTHYRMWADETLKGQAYLSALSNRCKEVKKETTGNKLTDYVDYQVLSDMDLEDITQGNIMLLITTEPCGPCKRLKPKFEELEKRYQGKGIKFKIIKTPKKDSRTESEQKFFKALDIGFWPQTFYLANGELVGAIFGGMSTTVENRKVSIEDILETCTESVFELPQ